MPVKSLYSNPSLLSNNFARAYLWFSISDLHQKTAADHGIKISLNLNYFLLVYLE